MLTPLNKLNDTIKQLAQQAGRNPHAIQWIAATKTQAPDTLRALFMAGQKQFGENYLQEALLKQAALNDLAIVWHFIGPVQSNKTQGIAQHFDWVHSIDREKIAQRLNAQRPLTLPPLNVCIQVKIGNEASKQGASPEAVIPLAKTIANLEHLTLRGIMALPPLSKNNLEQRRYFKQAHEIFEELKALGYPLDTLSMGTSEDYPSAIFEGATLLRLGSILFGKR